MSKTKHTPGPWKVSGEYTLEDEFDILRNIQGGGREAVGLLVVAASKPTEMSAADASLISAAPTLLEALIEAKHILELSFEDPELFSTYKHNVLQDIKCAIKKAKGES